MGENIALKTIPLEGLEPTVHQLVRKMGLDVQSIRRVSDTALLVRAWKVSIDENVPFAILFDTSGSTSSSMLYNLVQAKVKGRIAISDGFTGDAKELADMKGLYLVDGGMFTKMVVELKLLHLFKDYVSTPVTDPKDAKRSLDWAMEVCARGDFEKAHEMLTQVLETDPDNVDARYFRARCSVDRERYDEAKMDLDRVLKMDGGNIDALTLMAYTYHATGDAGSEIETYHALLKRYPKDLDAWLNLGVAFADTGDLDRAMSSFRNAISINASDPRAWNNLGIMLKRKGDLDGARDAFSRLAGITPEDENAWTNLIAISMSLNDTERAHADAKRFDARGARSAEGHLIIAWALFASGDRKGVEVHLSSAKALSPSAEKIWGELVPDYRSVPLEGPKPLGEDRESVQEPRPEPIPEPVKVPEPIEVPAQAQPPIPGPQIEAKDVRSIATEGTKVEEVLKVVMPGPGVPVIARPKDVIAPEAETKPAPMVVPVVEPEPAPPVEPEPQRETEVVKKEDIDSLLKDIAGPVPETGGTTAQKMAGTPKVEDAPIEVSPDVEEIKPITYVGVKPRERAPEASVDDILSLLEEAPPKPSVKARIDTKPIPHAETRTDRPKPKTKETLPKVEEGGVTEILAMLDEGNARPKTGPGTRSDATRMATTPPRTAPASVSKRPAIERPPPPKRAASEVDDIMSLLNGPAPPPPPQAVSSRSQSPGISARTVRTAEVRDDMDLPPDSGTKTGQAPRERADPGSSKERLMAARMLMGLNEHEALDELLAADGSSDAGLIKASALISAGKGREAYAILRDLGPSQEVVRGKISALMLTGDWGAVLGELKTLPEGNEKTLIRIVSLSHMRRFDDALQLVDTLDANVPLFRALRGLVLHKAGRLDEALPEYNKAVNDEPTLFFAWHNMSVIYMQRGMREEARTCVENAEEIWKEYT